MIKARWSEKTAGTYQEFQPSRIRSDQLWTLLRVARRPQSSSWDFDDYLSVFMVPTESLSRHLESSYRAVLKDLIGGLLDLGMAEGSYKFFSPTKSGWTITKKAFDDKYALALKNGRF